MARANKAKAKAPAKKPVKKPVKKVKATAKAKPAKRAEAEEAEHEPTGLELMLQTLSCPTATADRLCEVCEDSVQRVKDELTGIGAAELVWRGRPEREALGAAAHSLANELERHAEVMIALYDQLAALADDESDHRDLELDDVMERLRPMITAMAGPEE